mgnify:FL=1
MSSNKVLEESSLQEWINPTILENISTLKKEFANAKPYEHISIPNFLQDKIAKKIEDALFLVDYEEFDTDLYHFFKSKDFKHIQDLPKILQEFHSFIFSQEVIEFFKELTTTPQIKEKQGDLHSILLQHTHYLLCHDDQVDERIIAFILNLSRDFKEDDGGALEIFGHNSEKLPTQKENTIIPEFNQLNIFKVSSISFHQISEVESIHKNRLSISGWYYK